MNGSNNMKLRRVIISVLIGACLFLNFLPSTASLRVQSIGNVRWGPTVDGLQMSISASDAQNLDVPEFQVALRNAGKQDVTVNLGHMLANGKVQLPEYISLTLTDDGGKTRKLKFFDRRYPGVAGRIDDYVIPLRAGSTYTLNLSLDQFWSPDTKEFELKLFPGKYQITAQFVGGGARTSNPDMSGIKLMNFWQGQLQSNTIVVER
jgi:hypothetical protein